MQPPGRRLRLVVPGNIRHNSGGNVYNAALARELTASAPRWRPARGRRLAGGQRGGPTAAGRLGSAGTSAASVLRERRRGDRPASITLVDGLIACGAPEATGGRRRRPGTVWILLHMPLDGIRTWKRRALRRRPG